MDELTRDNRSNINKVSGVADRDSAIKKEKSIFKQAKKFLRGVKKKITKKSYNKHKSSDETKNLPRVGDRVVAYTKKKKENIEDKTNKNIGRPLPPVLPSDEKNIEKKPPMPLSNLKKHESSTDVPIYERLTAMPVEQEDEHAYLKITPPKKPPRSWAYTNQEGENIEDKINKYKGRPLPAIPSEEVQSDTLYDIPKNTETKPPIPFTNLKKHESPTAMPIEQEYKHTYLKMTSPKKPPRSWPHNKLNGENIEDEKHTDRGQHLSVLPSDDALNATSYDHYKNIANKPPIEQEDEQTYVEMASPKTATSSHIEDKDQNTYVTFNDPKSNNSSSVDSKKHDSIYQNMHADRHNHPSHLTRKNAMRPRKPRKQRR